jgi:magnesium transporter
MGVANQPPKTQRKTRVHLSTTALLSFMSLSQATALVAAELGVAAFFVIGVARPVLGGPSALFVLAACVLSGFVRTIDIEHWALFVPGGVTGRAERAFGPRAANLAAAAVLTERLLLVALGCALCGQYAASFAAPWTALWSVTARLTVQESVSVGAILLLGFLWIRARLRLDLSPSATAKAIWIGIASVVVLGLSSAAEGARHGLPVFAPLLHWPGSGLPGVSPSARVLQLLVGLSLVLPALGGGDTLARVAHQFAPPRLKGMRRTSLFVFVIVIVVTGVPSVLFVGFVPAAQTAVWESTPLSGLVQNVFPPWASGLMTMLALAATFLILVPAAHAALEDAEQLVRRLATQGILPERLSQAGPRDRRAPNSINATAASAVLVLFAAGGQVSWLGRAYGIAIAATLLWKIAVIVRLRPTNLGHQAYFAPFNVRLRGRVIPVGMIALGAVVALSVLAALMRADFPSLAALGLMVGLGLVMSVKRAQADEQAGVEDELLAPLTSADISPALVDVRPDNVLIAVRNPHSLTHVIASLQAAGDRDVVVVTVRLLGLDVDDETGGDASPTREERYLLSQALPLTERHKRPVRLLIVPAHNVFDGIITAALRLRSSEVWVGESSALPADEQAQLLGEAWERAEKPLNQHLRLVVYRHSGRTDSFHLGAHPPSLAPDDLDLIHNLWLDAAKSIGRHVHHHDVVRAALTQMEKQLMGTQREEVLAVIRQVARPADEIAAAIRAGDYSRLRDLVRNRHAVELASDLTRLDIEDQVIAFRILPRKDAAAVFEYLSREQQEALLKAMAQEEVASLLNNMAPDDRTMFLEELPASVTRQLLALLSPADRSVASTLLGYPENSIGRLMTPHYVSVREDWTVQEVLDYIRAHGQDSETLNVIYVVDDQGQLIDDIRIREILLRSPEARVADLMDRRFVALKAVDDQKAAVAVFRQYDRTALPVTDSAGLLIGIVTIDDVMDVAEAAATTEIQRIGGSEALDEPYMRIGFFTMVRKRASWLTALFLGEMLTATAMGVFEAEISRAVVLALFVPLIISSGGNSGSQAATLVIRALALGEVGLKDWWRVIRREILAGLALGAILGGIGFFRISIWSAFTDIYGAHWLLVAITVGLSLVGIVLWGTLVGSLLPFLLRRLGFDPATSSAPFVATLVDVTGLVIYFSVALLILRGTLL